METKKIIVIIIIILCFFAILYFWPTIGAIIGSAGVIGIATGIRPSLERNRSTVAEVDRSVDNLREIVAENERRSAEFAELDDDTESQRGKNQHLRDRLREIESRAESAKGCADRG